MDAAAATPVGSALAHRSAAACRQLERVQSSDSDVVAAADGALARHSTVDVAADAAVAVVEGNSAAAAAAVAAAADTVDCEVMAAAAAVAAYHVEQHCR